MDSVTTKKGTILPLLDLRGKKYLQIAHRIQWFTEEISKFTVETDFLKVEKDETIARAVVCSYDEAGNLLKKTTATKREDVKGFADHLEKAETGAIGRALILQGFGTQFALELDEGNRLADSPVPDTRKKMDAPLERKAVSVQMEQPKVESVVTSTVGNTNGVVVDLSPPVETPKKPSFRKPAKTEDKNAGGWK